MALLTESMLVDGLIGAAMLFAAAYYYMTATFDYWAKRGVPFVKPVPFFGNVKEQLFMRKSIAEVVTDVYYKLEGHKFGGYFEIRTPILLIRDADLIERILIKDFSNFADRDFSAVDLKNDPLTGNLFNLNGQIWRNLRNKLTPTFSSGKLKGMMQQMCNSGEVFLNEVEKVSCKGEAADAKSLASIFAIDVIASCAFGLQFKADSPEGKQFRKISNDFFAPSILMMLRIFVVVFMGPFRKLLRVRQFSKPVTDYIHNLVKSTMEFREKNNVMRNDFLQLMINLKTQESTGKEVNWKSELSEEDAYLIQKDGTQYNGIDKRIKLMTDECIAAQTFVFLTGGSEAISNAISLVLHDLSVNPDAQRKLHQELDYVLKKSQGKLTYEGLKEMSYLDMVIQETNRKYSVAQFLQRICMAPYKIPGTDVIIEKGVRVMIPISAIHTDPAIYPDPEKFIPERFEGNNFRSSGTYLPFGDGPRVCIAMRFAILELKVSLALMMSRYSVSLDPRTITPLKFDPTAFVLIPCGGIWINIHKRIPAA